MFDILTSWDAIEANIIDKYVEPFFASKQGGDVMDRLTRKQLLKEVCDRLKEPMYKSAGKDGVLNTLRYLFEVVRVGIFVCIQKNQLTAFIPFANANYRNNWSDIICFETSFKNKHGKVIRTTTTRLNDYIREKKRQLYSIRDIEPDVSKWSANAYFVNNAERDDVWGQHSLQEFYDMIDASVKAHQVNDCIFFLNKRDYPLLRKDLREPYFFLWGDKSAPKVKFHGAMAPIVSPYTNNGYMDLPWPIAQDWMLATDPDNYFNASKLEAKWDDKLPTAFFRGSLTGRVDRELNQRAILVALNVKWKQSKYTNVKGKHVPLLDAGITSWNLSDKVDKHGVIRFTHPREMPFKLADRVPMDEAVKRYKYILNVDGHARPNRTGFLLLCGSLMIMVESKYVVGAVTWLDAVLKPWTHYVPVDADLSNLEERIRWCIAHDDECQKIVAAAKAAARKFITGDTIMEYIAYTLNAISNRCC